MSLAPKNSAPREPTYGDLRAVERVGMAAGDLRTIITSAVPPGPDRDAALAAVQQAVAAAERGLVA